MQKNFGICTCFLTSSFSSTSGIILGILSGTFFISTVALSVILFNYCCAKKFKICRQDKYVEYYSTTKQVPNHPTIHLSFGKSCSFQDMGTIVNPLVNILNETVAIMSEFNQSDIKVLRAVEILLTHVFEALDESQTIHTKKHILEIRENVCKLSTNLIWEQFGGSREVLSTPVATCQPNTILQQESSSDMTTTPVQPKDIRFDRVGDYRFSYSVPDVLTTQDKINLMKASVAGMMKVVDEKCKYCD